MEERINKVRENFSLNRPARGDELAKLHAKVDLLSDKLDLLTTALTDQGTIKVPAKRRKAAPKAKAKKIATRKAVAKKPASSRSRKKST